MSSPLASQPPWPVPQGPPAHAPLAADLEVDVAVVGGGITGAGVAYFLREGGVRVALLEGGRLGGGTTARSAGLVLTGLSDHLDQVEHGVGREQAAAAWLYTVENRRLLGEVVEREGIRCGLERTGAYVVATLPGETKDLERSKAILDEIGVAATLLDAADLERRPLAPRGLAALHQPEDLVVDPGALVRGLAARAAAAARGVRVFEETRVVSIRVGGEGVTLEVAAPVDRAAGPTVRAAIAVLATNARAPLLDGFFAERVVPVRGQGFITAPAPGRALDAPFVASFGHEFYRQLEDGRILAAAVSWEPKEGDIGYDETPTAEFQRYLEKFRAHRIKGAPSDLAIERRFAATAALSADGLPLVGPVPGKPALVVAVAYNMRGLSVGLAAARSVARLIIDGRRDYPACFSLTRFLD